MVLAQERQCICVFVTAVDVCVTQGSPEKENQ